MLFWQIFETVSKYNSKKKNNELQEHSTYETHTTETTNKTHTAHTTHTQHTLSPLLSEFKIVTTIANFYEPFTAVLR